MTLPRKRTVRRRAAQRLLADLNATELRHVRLVGLLVQQRWLVRDGLGDCATRSCKATTIAADACRWCTYGDAEQPPKSFWRDLYPQDACPGCRECPAHQHDPRACAVCLFS